jgi:uridine kinase
VRRGESRHIFPHQERADIMFNGALVYELAVLRPLTEPHLLRVSLDHPQWIEANRLLSFLTWVKPASAESVPSNSILREFIGGSNLRDYHPGV